MPQQAYDYGEIGNALAGLGHGFQDLTKGISVISGNDPVTELNKSLAKEQANIAKMAKVDPYQAAKRQEQIETLMEKTSKFPMLMDSVGKTLIEAKKSGKKEYKALVSSYNNFINKSATDEDKQKIAKYLGEQSLQSDDLKSYIKENFNVDSLDGELKKKFIEKSTISTLDSILGSMDGGESMPKNKIELAYRAVAGDKKAMAVLDLISGKKGGGGKTSGDGTEGPSQVTLPDGTQIIPASLSEFLQVANFKTKLTEGEDSAYSNIPLNADDQIIRSVLIEKYPNMDDTKLDTHVDNFKSIRSKVEKEIRNKLNYSADKQGATEDEKAQLKKVLDVTFAAEMAQTKGQYEQAGKDTGPLGEVISGLEVYEKQPVGKGPKGGVKINLQMKKQSSQNYQTKEQVRKDYQAGKITQQQAVQILNTQFGVK